MKLFLTISFVTTFFLESHCSAVENGGPIVPFSPKGFAATDSAFGSSLPTISGVRLGKPARWLLKGFVGGCLIGVMGCQPRAEPELVAGFYDPPPTEEVARLVLHQELSLDDANNLHELGILDSDKRGFNNFLRKSPECAMAEDMVQIFQSESGGFFRQRLSPTLRIFPGCWNGPEEESELTWQRHKPDIKLNVDLARVNRFWPGWQSSYLNEQDWEWVSTEVVEEKLDTANLTPNGFADVAYARISAIVLNIPYRQAHYHENQPTTYTWERNKVVLDVRLDVTLGLNNGGDGTYNWIHLNQDITEGDFAKGKVFQLPRYQHYQNFGFGYQKQYQPYIMKRQVNWNSFLGDQNAEKFPGQDWVSSGKPFDQFLTNTILPNVYGSRYVDGYVDMPYYGLSQAFDLVGNSDPTVQKILNYIVNRVERSGDYSSTDSASLHIDWGNYTKTGNFDELTIGLQDGSDFEGIVYLNETSEESPYSPIINPLPARISIPDFLLKQDIGDTDSESLHPPTGFDFVTREINERQGIQLTRHAISQGLVGRDEESGNGGIINYVPFQEMFLDMTLPDEYEYVAHLFGETGGGVRKDDLIRVNKGDDRADLAFVTIVREKATDKIYLATVYHRTPDFTEFLPDSNSNSFNQPVQPTWKE